MNISDDVPQLRLARESDRPAMQALLTRSVRDLSRDHYSPEQIEGALRHIFGIDGTLIRDGTYFVVEVGEVIAACGGWSRRRTLFGGDQASGRSDDLADPAVDAAKIRAFYVDPAFARRGIGRMLLNAARDAAIAAGFTRLELMATLPGVPLYAALGFGPTGSYEQVLPDGVRVPFVPMEMRIG